MASSILLKAVGLIRSPNSLNNPEGALAQASNIIIQRDNVIQSRRGFKLYGNSLGSTTDRAKQLMTYKGRLLRHYNDVLQFDDGEGEFTSFSGSYTEPEAGIRIKSIESNGNFYFTTSDGIKKISANNVSELSSDPGYITNAGGVKALDIETELDITLGQQNGFLPGDSTVAYRQVWGIKDANNNLILGTPSARSEVFNPLIDLVLLDFNNVLGNLDSISSSGLITDGNYVSTLSLPINSTSQSTRTNLIALATKLDTDIQYTEGAIDVSTSQRTTTTNVQIVFSATVADYIAVGDKIICSAFANTNVNNNVLTVTSVATTTINATPTTAFSGTDGAPVAEAGTSLVYSYNYRNITQPANPSTPSTHNELQALQDYLLSIIERLQLELSGVISTFAKTSYIDSLDVTTTANVRATFNIPEEITTNYFYQIYRSSIKTATGTDVLANLTPNDEMRLVYEAFPTQDELDAGYITIIDNTPEEFFSKAANLYTNETTGEGILQANDVPPLAKDINQFKNVAFYANTKTRYRQSVFLLGVSQILEDYNNGLNPKLLITDGTLKNEYNFIKGSQEVSVVTTVADVANSLNGTYWTINNARDATSYYVFNNMNLTSNTGATVTITSDDHKLSNGDQVTLIGTNSTPSLDGTYTVSNVTTDDFDITPSEAVTVAATVGRWYKNISDKSLIRVDLEPGDSANDVASKINLAFKAQADYDFTSSVNTNDVTITNIDEGPSEDASNASGSNSPGFSYSITQGNGEKLKKKIQTITTVADVAGSLAGDYLLLNSGVNQNLYYFWFNVSGSGSDPLISGRTGVQVDLVTNDSANDVASALNTAINTISSHFSSTVLNNVITVTNEQYGTAATATNGGSSPGFSYAVVQEGAIDVLLSNLASPSQATDATARSLVRVINRNNNETIYAYYLSGPNDPPGSILFESRQLSGPAFYTVANTENTGSSFSPDFSPSTIQISGNTQATQTVITTSTNHGLIDGDQIIIVDHLTDSSYLINAIPPIFGLWTVSNVTNTTFTIPLNVPTGANGATGTTATFIKVSNAEVADNETKANRIYYSKIQQPEAVPIVNYIDVGLSNKQILRIFPLRDSLFVLKEEGMYRISGEVAPFNLALFDSSAILAAPDSLGVIDNLIYGWFTKGIQVISEAGVGAPISRDIDNIILPLSSPNYPNFRTATWGVGYDSDSSYYLATVEQTDDEVATIIYRFGSLTRSWTTFDKTNTCGIINPTDDKLYMGAGDTNFIEQERKTFTRLDYADREFDFNINSADYLSNGERLKLSSTSNVEIGDVVVQEQLISVYDYNMLLKKIDLDPSITTKDYFSTLEITGGANLRQAIEDLAAKLDADPDVNDTDFAASIASLSGTIASNTAQNPTVVTDTAHGLLTNRYIAIAGSNSTPSIDGNFQVTVLTANTFTVPVAVLTPGTSGTWATLENTFTDIRACFNIIVDKLNDDISLTFNNYKMIEDTTTQEAIVTDIFASINQIELNIELPFVAGPITIYKAIETITEYDENHMGDPLGWKHLREATIMFESKAFTKAILSFNSDIFPEFLDIEFDGDGNGIFGHQNFGSNFFGGTSNQTPFRTYIPRQCQRCRFISTKFTHKIAREQYAIYGITLTGEIGQSERAYRR